MTVPFTKLDIPLSRLAVVCRGCLAESGEMKNIYEWGIHDDYFRVTAIETSRRPGISELLCSSCEAALISCKQFQDRCQLSDRILKSTLIVNRTKTKPQKGHKNQVTCILHDKQLDIRITAPKTDARIRLPCPYHCEENFLKKSDLQAHLKKTHNLSENIEIQMQYYCAEAQCVYHVSSKKQKWFTGRKFLNQHINKVHKTKSFLCNDCGLCFSTETDFQRHSKSCNYVFICQMCDTKYNTNEKLMVHLKRKHPNVHQMYKAEKAEKRKLENDIDLKKKNKKPETLVSEEINAETVTESWNFNEQSSKAAKLKDLKDAFCDSPKKSFATQVPEHINNDVALPSWAQNETKTDEISTQVAFEDLLSLKSQNSEDDMFFSEAVSLSDIQTQTFPVEFGLSRSNKETQSLSSQTQSPDLNFKETQTCCCHDSGRNFKIFDSLSSSPASINFTSTETQTQEPKTSVKSDVLLSFSSAETQTCFDDNSSI
uniref:SFRICE_013922 n=1 Tax=Spodoptera frugiperda TaxID=7108 RepID=A0A2H1V2D0_SPOFR